MHTPDAAESLQRIFKQKVIRCLRNWKRIITKKKKNGMIEKSGGSNIFPGLSTLQATAFERSQWNVIGLSQMWCRRLTEATGVGSLAAEGRSREARPMSTGRQVLPDGRVGTACTAFPSPRRSRQQQQQQQQAGPALGSAHESSPRHLGRVSPQPRGQYLVSGC